MIKCEEIKDYLKGKNIKIEREEECDFDLGNYPAQSKEESIYLEDGYLFYIVNSDENKCYINISRRTEPNDINDNFLDDNYFDGYFDINTLDNLLKLIK